jgi:hypothetical protein
MGPPENVLPGVAALELVLVNTGAMAVSIASADVYPTGVVLRLVLQGVRAAQRGVESGEGAWRFGIQFSDGRKAQLFGFGGLSQLGPHARGSSAVATAAARRGATPEGPVLATRGGSGSRSMYRQDCWLWPLPPAGDLTLACEWPNLEVPLTITRIDSRVIREAADRAVVLWPLEDLPDYPATEPTSS